MKNPTLNDFMENEFEKERKVAAISEAIIDEGLDALQLLAIAGTCVKAASIITKSSVDAMVALLVTCLREEEKDGKTAR